MCMWGRGGGGGGRVVVCILCVCMRVCMFDIYLKMYFASYALQNTSLC